MTFGGRPSIAKYAALCAVLFCILTTEFAFVHFAKRDGENYARETVRITGEIRALGPLAATKEELKACEASFGENFRNGQTIGGSTLSGKARMTMELAHVFSESGLEEKAASTAAASIVNSPEATLAATCIAKSEGVRLRSVEAHPSDNETAWTIDATCAEKSLPELLSILGKNSSGIALDSLDMRSNGNSGIDLRIEFVLPVEKEAPR